VFKNTECPFQGVFWFFKHLPFFNFFFQHCLQGIKGNKWGGEGEDFSGAGLLPYTKCEVCDDLGSLDGGTTHNPRFWQCFCNLVGMWDMNLTTSGT
jgi:hypothetical protein